MTCARQQIVAVLAFKLSHPASCNMLTSEQLNVPLLLALSPVLEMYYLGCQVSMHILKGINHQITLSFISRSIRLLKTISAVGGILVCYRACLHRGVLICEILWIEWGYTPE